MLVDRAVHGQPRKLLMHADRNGHFYVLDRTNGKFLAGTPFIRQTGTPASTRTAGRSRPPGRTPAPEGSVVAPTIGGAHQLPGAVVQPGDRLGLPRVSGGAQRYFSDTPAASRPGRQYPGGRGASTGERGAAGIKAIDPETGKTMWEFTLNQGSLTAGVLATAGGVVFAASREGHLFALDATNGTPLAVPDGRGD